ncbi:MAG: TonB-dependent receptor, partial [Acidobacteriaceae bacterium]|nr:TonB-dependent receptor [Acidobacteriaceae bacterium]
MCISKQNIWVRLCPLIAIVGLVFGLSLPRAQAQMDQGTITGVVSDNSGATIPNAKVTLNATDTGLTLERRTNESGIYVFSPVKIGRYSITIMADGFQTSKRENLVLNVQARLGINFELKPGAVTENVTVDTAPPLLDTQTGAVGQVVDSKTINETPLNGRNWVFIAQLSAGVAPPQGQTRGSGKGDFVANGQRAEQNNFILDGVDNNTNLVDFLNGATFVMRPPPDALAEFNLQTSNYSAEFGHSAGAVLNASIKSGTNAIHGSLWEYFRSDKMNARNWNALTVPAFHQNQFGATLGFPILKDKLFYFGDIEANRVSFGSPGVFTVPTARMRTGDFTELLNPSLTGYSGPINLYQPGSRGTVPLGQPCGRAQNVFCPADINATAQNILNLYPSPNVNSGKTYNNYNTNIGRRDNTIQWDQRLDWNISTKDQIYGRYSYAHEIINNGLPLGSILDGSGYGGERDTNLSQNGMFSEAHIFSPSLTNEFRAGYNWGVFRFLQPNANNSTLASSLGLGNVPFGPFQGGLPQGQLQGTVGASYWGSVGTSNESQNVYQILDNVTKIAGNHSMKFGVAFQNVRFYYTYAEAPRGQYNFNGSYTSIPGSSATSGTADFLANQMSSAYISNVPAVHDQQWYDSAYFQDDWRATSKLTLNLGLRWDWYQPYAESRDQQANFVLTGPVGLNSSGVGTGRAVYQLPTGAQRYALSPAFVSLLAANNVAVQYVDNARLLEAQKVNFAPRFGFAYQLSPKSVIRGGYGIFYGGLQSHGNGNLGANYPFTLNSSYNQPTCNATSCSPLPYTLQSGLPPLNASAVPTQPGFHATDASIKTPYTQNYSLSFQYALSSDFVASVAYVGNVSRHLSTYW